MLNRRESLIVKASRLIFGISSFVLILTMSAHAYTGKVIDVFGADITTIQVEGEHNLRVKDKIDLTYMAGVLPMQVGIYEITAVQDNVILSKPVSITMPADKGMKVQIDILNKSIRKSPLIKSKTIKNKQKPQKISLLGQEFMPSQPDPQAMESGPRDMQFNNSRLENVGSRQADQRVSTVKIQGEVVEVMGKDVRIKLISSGNPRKGFAVDLIYMISSGMELPVGTWKVRSINKREVIASADDKNVKPRVGMKALIYKKQEKVGVQKQLPLEIAVDEDGFPNAEGLFEQRIDSRITQTRKTQKYILGIEFTDSSYHLRRKFAYGVIVLNVIQNSAAQRGGLKKGDIIYRINGEAVKSKDHVLSMINNSKGKVKLKFQRNGKHINKTIKLDQVK